VKADELEEERLSVQLNTVRNANVANRTSWTRALDGLHHGFLCADAFKNRVGTNAFGQFLDSRNAFISAFCDEVSRPKLCGELLSRLMPAHRNDALRSHLLRRQHTEQTDRPVADIHVAASTMLQLPL
jgi:hypothetical protein